MIAAKTWNQRRRRFSHSRIDEVTFSTPSRQNRVSSASPVSRISIRTQQQRKMKMRFAIPCLECNFHHRIQCIDLLQCKVTSGVKNQTIDPGGEILPFRQQLSAPAISRSEEHTSELPS